MIFGSGGGGGVINRYNKRSRIQSIVLSGGSHDDRRRAVDSDQPLGGKVAFRRNGMYEGSDTFRNFVGLQRHGVNPGLTYTPGKATRITLNHENSLDAQTVATRRCTGPSLLIAIR